MKNCVPDSGTVKDDWSMVVVHTCMHIPPPYVKLIRSINHIVADNNCNFFVFLISISTCE